MPLTPQDGPPETTVGINAEPVGSDPTGHQRQTLSPEQLPSRKTPGGANQVVDKKSMQVKVKQADPLTDPEQPLTTEGPASGAGEAGMEGSPDLGAPNEQFEGNPTGQEMGGGLEDQEQTPEPYGLQVLRRLLDDLGGLLHDHDGFMQHLEDESTRGFLQKFLEMISELMDEAEDLQTGHPRYGEFPALGGEEEEMGAAPNIPGLEETEGQDVEAGSGQEQETTPEEALMGMAPNAAQGIPGEKKSLTRQEYFAQIKSLRAQHKSLNAKGKQIEHIEEQQEEKEEKEGFDHGHKKLVKQLSQLRKDLMNLPNEMGDMGQDAEGIQEKRLTLIKKIETAERKIKEYQNPKKSAVPGVTGKGIPGHMPPGLTGKKSKDKPSNNFSSKKARHILSEENPTLHGHPITEAQRGMLGAAAGRGKTMSKKDLLQERKYLRQRWATIRNQEQKALSEQAREKSLLTSMWQNAKTNNEKSYIQARYKSLETPTSNKNLETEKTYIKKRWKELGKLLSKSYHEDDEGMSKWKNENKDMVAKFAKRFNGGHKNLVIESRKFLSQLAKEYDYGAEHQHEAYHLGKSLASLIGDVCGKGSVEAGLRNLAKTLITEEMPAEVGNQPKGPSKYDPKGERAQQWEESDSVIKGKKEFDVMAREYNEVEVTHPSSNPQAKPHHEWMPYHEGEHLPIESGVGPSDTEGEKGFPMCEEDSEINLTSPDSPSKYNPGNKWDAELQQWKPSESIVDVKSWRPALLKGLKDLATTSNYFKMLAKKKDFGDEDRGHAAELAIVLVPMEALAPHLAGLQDTEGMGSLESPIDLGEEWLDEEMQEPEHADIAEEMEVEPEEEEGESPVEHMEEEIEEEPEEEESGSVHEKYLKNGKVKTLQPDTTKLMDDTLRQAQTINNMQNSLQALLARFPN